MVALQEIKCADEKFPAEAFEALGYNCAVHGQKTYNGVAILRTAARGCHPAACPAATATTMRAIIEALVSGAKGTVRRGLDLCAERQSGRHRKIRLQARLAGAPPAHARELLAYEEPVALMGDYNVIPTPIDCYDPKAWAGRRAVPAGIARGASGASNIWATPTPSAPAMRETDQYTFWDYQAGAWRKDHGIRIDHILLSPQAADRLKACEHRQACARPRKTVRPCAGVVRAGGVERRDGIRRQCAATATTPCVRGNSQTPMATAAMITPIYWNM